LEAWIPELFHWDAGKDEDESDAYGPAKHHTPQTKSRVLKVRDVGNAMVHKQSAYLDPGEAPGVENLTDDQPLERVLGVARVDDVGMDS
jgi:hypothetical protein